MVNMVDSSVTLLTLRCSQPSISGSSDMSLLLRSRHGKARALADETSNVHSITLRSPLLLELQLVLSSCEREKCADVCRTVAGQQNFARAATIE